MDISPRIWIKLWERKDIFTCWRTMGEIEISISLIVEAYKAAAMMISIVPCEYGVAVNNIIHTKHLWHQTRFSRNQISFLQYWLMASHKSSRKWMVPDIRFTQLIMVIRWSNICITITKIYYGKSMGLTTDITSIVLRGPTIGHHLALQTNGSETSSVNTLRPRQNGRHFADDVPNTFLLKIFEFR